jgi:hypothetical protein
MADDEPRDQRAERRDRRKQAERDRVAKHGRNIARVYRDAILKRLRRKGSRADRPEYRIIASSWYIA